MSLALYLPVMVQAPDLRDRNWRKIGDLVDAAEDGRAPGAVAFSSALWERDDSYSEAIPGIKPELLFLRV
ncbi:MAG: hypothetical protein QHJ82_04945 [Verrucomicrobiota bacterium]|nr:hypothetical protein [Verrucomicrobiota bacterium]